MLATALGVPLAYLLEPSGRPWSLALAVAAALLATALWLHERRRPQALLAWLNGPLDAPAPRQGGALGELGARFERVLRSREHDSATERERLAQFLSAIEASPNGVLLLDAEGAIVWLNRTAAEHFGLDPLRDRAQRITHIVRAPAFAEHLQSGGTDRELTMPSPRGDATLSVLVRPYGGTMRLVLSQDITERERTDAMRRDFVANVSHEIRSPLTVLAGFVDTLLQLPLTPAERERALTVMRQQAQRMQTLVTDLLALAQIEGAPRPSAEHWIEVAELMRRLQTDIAASDAGQHRVVVTTQAAASLSGVESELFSAFWNLAGNALRYTPPGGDVTVTWRLLPEGGGEFCVCDSGPGIAREHLPRLTERFYRVDASRSRATGGTGLGLAIVKHVVQRHGGELSIASEVGKGSQFRVRLPAHRVRAAAAVATPT
ncbi:MAG: phosphate regulon sensor histidine kinase PhoR [Rubrivivax sp.]|nr:phosphate regulon sensor histidine kinase PhoR [Rubrivivax sp.]